MSKKNLRPTTEYYVLLYFGLIIFIDHSRIRTNEAQYDN